MAVGLLLGRFLASFIFLGLELLSFLWSWGTQKYKSPNFLGGGDGGAGPRGERLELRGREDDGWIQGHMGDTNS